MQIQETTLTEEKTLFSTDIPQKQLNREETLLSPNPEAPLEKPLSLEEIKSLSSEDQITGNPKKTDTSKELLISAPTITPSPFFLPPPAPVAPGYTSMKPEIFQLFERMVMAVTILQDKGATETTIHLNSADFTLFANAEIVIREYSTAPKAYNVEFLGNAQNTALFAQSAQDLVAAINSANYNFKINKIESSSVHRSVLYFTGKKH